FFAKSLQTGFMAGTMPQPTPVALAKREAAANVPAATGLRVVFRPDPSIGDGSHANNTWLQELPKPITRLTWDNAAIISPATAKSRDLKTGDLVDLRNKDRSVKAPVFIVPGQPDDCVTIHLGFGRTRAGRAGDKVGFNAYAIRTSDA